MGYQKANIRIQGFEKAEHPDNFFDVAVENIPFGDYKLHENRYDSYKSSYHNTLNPKFNNKSKGKLGDLDH